ncbi:Bifunctional polymyxin resistance protein ArnA [Triticum urartu]|uniref:Bifunctional polymyxin resistance protein ArnA n=1 Tax=Triticum urartu TaxID=4572 RepID=M7ZH19_TRIUA|nr:Bifunctional polymyxin resistance protein ArnA [Triticum urartu]
MEHRRIPSGTAAKAPRKPREGSLSPPSTMRASPGGDAGKEGEEAGDARLRRVRRLKRKQFALPELISGKPLTILFLRVGGWICSAKTINLAAICTPADYNTRPLDTIYSNFIDALPVVKYCSENSKRLIHFSTCEVYGKTIGSFLPKDHPLRKEPEFYVLTEDESPCIFGPIVKQRWSYACAKQLIERLVFAEGAENGLEFTIVRPFNWIGPRMDFIPGVDGPSEGVPRVLACFSNNLLRREPLKLVDGGESQRTFVYIKDAIEAVLLMIENPARANGHIFNVGNPDNEVTVRELAEMMTEVYAKVSGEPPLEEPVIDVSAKEFYGEGYDDSDKRIPDMTLINKQLGWNPKTPLKDLLETTLTYQHKTYKEAVKTQMCLATATPSS